MDTRMEGREGMDKPGRGKRRKVSGTGQKKRVATPP
jgi:hypothetical protein